MFLFLNLSGDYLLNCHHSKADSQNNCPFLMKVFVKFFLQKYGLMTIPISPYSSIMVNEIFSWGRFLFCLVISRYIFCSFCDAFNESTDVENKALGESNNYQSTPLQISDSDYEPDSKEDTSDSDNKEGVAIGNLRRFSREIWGKCRPVKRSKIPHDINGTCVYKISVDVGNKWRNLQDGRSWGPSIGTELSGYQQVRYFNCNGF